MKSKLLLVSALFALALTGCSTKFNNEPEQKPQPETPSEESNNQQQQPLDTPVDPETPEGKATIKDALYKAYLNYSDINNFSAVNVNAEAKDVNLALNLDVFEETTYGDNHLDFSVSDFNAKVDAYARINQDNTVEGMIKASDVKGKVALDAAIFQPEEEEEPIALAAYRDPELDPEAGEGEEDPLDGEDDFEGFFAEGEFTIAPLAVNAYFKDGNVYLDYSDQGVRNTIDNADDLAGQIMELVYGIEEFFYEGDEEDIDPVQPEPQGLVRRDGGEPVFFLNELIDELTGAPERKIYDVLEEDGFVIDASETIPPTNEEKEQAKQEIDSFVDETLPLLVASQMMTFKELANGSFELGVSLNKTKMVALITIAEKMAAVANDSEEVPESSLPNRNDPEPVQPQPGEDEEPSIADMFKKYCDKFDLTANVTLDKDGFVRNVNVNYDIAASAEDEVFDFFGLELEASASFAFSGKISTTFKYNSEVTFELPSDLNTYVYIGYDEGDEGETELVPQD